MTKPMNPLEEFFKHEEKTAAQRHEVDLQHWNTWNENGRTIEHLDSLMDRFQPVVNQKLRQWHSDFLIPKAAFKAELQKQLINALNSYDPNKGANLNTHINIRLQKAQRFRNEHQNIAKIQENLITKIGPMQRAQEDLADQFGRTPLSAELAAHMGMPVKKLVQLQMMANRKDTFSSQYESDPDLAAASRDQEVLHLLPHSLNEKQKQVFDYFYGKNGKPQVQSTSAIAGRLGLSEPAVSRLKSQIADKFKSYR